MSPRISRQLRAEAIQWCDRLALDRAQPAWTIRFTHGEIAASPAKQIAWQEFHAARVRRHPDTPPRILWREAADQLRAEQRDPPPPPPPKPPRPKPPPPPKPSPRPIPPSDPVPTKKERTRMAKKQTRRAISVSRITYDRAKAFAEASGIPLSQLTEQALAHVIEGCRADDSKAS